MINRGDHLLRQDSAPAVHRCPRNDFGSSVDRDWGGYSLGRGLLSQSGGRVEAALWTIWHWDRLEGKKVRWQALGACMDCLAPSAHVTVDVWVAERLSTAPCAAWAAARRTRFAQTMNAPVSSPRSPAMKSSASRSMSWSENPGGVQPLDGPGRRAGARSRPPRPVAAGSRDRRSRLA